MILYILGPRYSLFFNVLTFLSFYFSVIWQTWNTAKLWVLSPPYWLNGSVIFKNVTGDRFWSVRLNFLHKPAGNIKSSDFMIIPALIRPGILPEQYTHNKDVKFFGQKLKMEASDLYWILNFREIWDSHNFKSSCNHFI